MNTDQTAHPLPSSVRGANQVGSREGSGLAVSLSPQKLIRKTGDWRPFRELEALLCSVPGRYAADYHDNVVWTLRRAGWAVMKEYNVCKHGVGGRIDIFATKTGNEWLALELDNRAPRGKSIVKLEEWLPKMPGLLTAILLRNPR